MFAIAVHGGAGVWGKESRERALSGVQAAVEAGARILAADGTAVDAAVAAALVLENDPVFNAGTGSTLNLAGEVECDAAVMDGRSGFGAGVAAVRNVRNPILLARKILEQTDHVLLCGSGAESVARAFGLATGNPPTPERVERWKAALAELRAGSRASMTPSRLAKLIAAHPELAQRHGTVGAVARDTEGHCAAATSTGGVLLKLPGRIGDTPILGAGTFASRAGAASATGPGEWVMRALTTKLACDAMEGGAPPQRATRSALTATGKNLGLIAVDAKGRIGITHDSPLMPHAFKIAGKPAVARLTSSRPRR